MESDDRGSEEVEVEGIHFHGQLIVVSEVAARMAALLGSRIAVVVVNDRIVARERVHPRPQIVINRDRTAI